MVLLVGINSPFGQFKAVSTAMLKIRIHELSAIAAMEEVKKSKAYGESVEEATLEHIPLKRKRMIPISK